MRPINNSVDQVKLPVIRVMLDKASTMNDTISFTIGEPDFDTPKNIIDAAVKALESGGTHYTPNPGILPLREAIAENIKHFDQIEYNPNTEIMVTNGGMEAIYLTMMVLTNPGDEIIVSNPCYANYDGMITQNRCVPVYVPTSEDNGFNYEEDRLRAAITDKTKIIIVNTPSNPTGAVTSRESLEMIARVANEYDLAVIFDEVYKHLIYNDEEFFNIARLPGMRERTFVIDSVSKTYAMTGWRIGYVLGPSEIIGIMPKFQENMLSCVNTAAQYGAIEALTGPQGAVKEMYNSYLERRDLVLSLIEGIDGISCRKPEGAFYVFMNIKDTGLSSMDFAMRLLDETGVVVAPGSGFGTLGDGFVRLSYATSTDNIREGFKRIKTFVDGLAK